MTDHHDIKWQGNDAFLSERKVGWISAAGEMWEVCWLDSKTAGPVNRSRAKDAVSSRLVYDAGQL